MSKRLLGLLALALGLCGVLAGIAGGYGVWLLGTRVEQANERIFAALDQGLGSAEERIRGAQKRVQESRISTADISQDLRDGSVQKARELAGALSSQLQKPDAMLETSAETVRSVQQLLEVSSLAGASVDPAALDNVLDKLDSVRTALQQTEDMLRAIGAPADAKGSEPEEGRSRLVKLVGRALATVLDVDTRLEDLVTRLSERRADVQEAKESMSRHIWLTTLAGYLVLLWIALGQAALCRCGWKACCP
jgi:hypothetical protein